MVRCRRSTLVLGVIALSCVLVGASGCARSRDVDAAEGFANPAAPAARAVLADAKTTIGLLPFSMTGSFSINNALEPLEICLHLNTVDGDKPREYDVVFGSRAEGEDLAEVQRKLGTGKLEYSATLGQVVVLDDGYGIASGKAPVLMTRRVRAASDGTQFGIEVLRDPDVHRVYLYTIADNHKVQIEVYKDGKWSAIPSADWLTVEDTYIEVRPDGTYAKGPSNTGGTDVKIKHYNKQMKTMIIDDAFPRPPQGAITKAEEILKHPPRSSLLTRFAAQFPNSTIKFNRP